MGNAGNWPILRRAGIGLFKVEFGRILNEDIPQDQEAGGVVCAIFDVLLEHIDAMKLCCEPAGDGCALLL